LSRHIGGDKYPNDDRPGETNHTAFIVKAGLKIIQQGQGLIFFCLDPQFPADIYELEHLCRDVTDNRPYSASSQGKSQPAYSQNKPGRSSRGNCGEGDYNLVHSPPSDKKIRLVFSPMLGQKSDENRKGQSQTENQESDRMA